MAQKIRSGVSSTLLRGDLRELLGRHADIALAALVVVIVGMMIIPLPTFLLDILICLNIAVGVTLLLIAIYVSDALKIATFPTLLLITTLFRLALEVSATRLILLKADAGEVIDAFGNFVVAGNLVVGAVIFTILTLIQFIVISKGSERVAEVGARFTLDAMPGKQMSIDAELRAGHIDHTEARRRRAVLARESQFFGSMDGAMKFVKGDAIAGIVVLLTNIVGGLIIGVAQRGMDVASAAKTYTVLTIGEGLVSQIPALIVSTGAGIIVTRVSSEDEGGHLGRDIGMQILGQPKALAIAAALLGVLAIVPGLPAVPFLLLGVIFGFVAFRLMKTPADVPGGELIRPAPGSPAARGTRTGIKGTPRELPAPMLTPIAVDLSANLASAMTAEPDGGRFLLEVVPAMRERFFAETGIAMPAVKLRGPVPALAAGAYVIRLNEIPMASGDVGTDQTPEEVIGTHLYDLLARYGYEFVGIQESQTLLEGLERSHPALVREVVPKLVSPVLLADVLRRLAEERVSLRSLREILGALAEWAPHERDPVVLTEHVRAALRRQITFKHAGQSGTLEVYLLDPMIEEAIREAIHKTATGSYLALEPELSRDILKAVVATIPAASAEAVVLTAADIRRYVKRLVETELPRTAVLSYQELSPDAKLRPLGRVRAG